MMAMPHDDIEALRHMAREFTEGFNSGDVDRLMRFYGATYIDVNLRRPVQSKAERREYYRRVIERKAFQVQVHPDEIQLHGDLALVRGRIDLILGAQPPDRSIPSELRYLEVARKEDGVWKAIWGMDGPVQEYDPGADS